MCSIGTLAWMTTNANLLAGLLGIVGSILLAVPTWLGSGLREDSLRIEELRARLKDPGLLEPLVLDAISKSLGFLRREQYWSRAGALFLVLAFALALVDATCHAK
jgi:hypothetical protein